ncbi:innexin inx2-like [Stegodyphus dumicola]|uniref:innexin inx2-like n=1 Tax=Stegodyphus dumicola TaxID=202533 RepID=UPI0015ABBFE9|nr:innexin inx2-like [Stegodyphus dumicola]
MIRNVLKSIFLKKKVVDNFIFYLCYRWTVWMLVIFSFIVTCRLVLGDSFTCISSTDRIPLRYMQTKCYADSVYSSPFQDDGKVSLINKSTYEYQRYQWYYSWVNLFFLLHAFNFYLPHLFWKSYELGYTRSLIAGVENVFAKEEKRNLKLLFLAKYVLATQGKHKIYTALYIFFETCNYAISLAQTLWLIAFFDVTGVPDSIPISIKTWSDFKEFYFPPEGTCVLSHYGTSGNRQKYAFLCALPLNYLYMKLFLFLHAWYIFLTILCGIVLVYRIILLVPSLRMKVILFSAPLTEKETLKSLCSRLSYSDAFFLTRLQKIMTDIDFAQMLEKICVVSQYKDGKHEGDSLSLTEEVRKEIDSSTATSPL